MANSVFIDYLGGIPASSSGGTIVIPATLSVTRVLVGNGTAAAPSVAAASDTDTGMYLAGTNAWGTSAGGFVRFVVNETEGQFRASMLLAWSSGEYPTGSDLTIARASARVAILGPTTGVRLNWSAADTLNVQNFAGTSGATLNAGAYTVGGVAGADFNGAVTTLTVVKGIVTAAS